MFYGVRSYVGYNSTLRSLNLSNNLLVHYFVSAYLVCLYFSFFDNTL